MPTPNVSTDRKRTNGDTAPDKRDAGERRDPDSFDADEDENTIGRPPRGPSIAPPEEREDRE